MPDASAATAADTPDARPTGAAAVVTFFRVVEEAPAPVRADRSGLGSLPTRAYRHCEAVTSAAGWGWHVAPPLAFDLLWDGDGIWWRAEGREDLGDWLPLRGAAQFPHFAARWDAAAPAEARGYSPPFLTALQEPGVVQVWTGLLARTAPGWSLLVRGVANPPRRDPGFHVYEGIVEADRWFGPLFTNLRLRRTGSPVRLDPAEPFLQAQPVPQAAYADALVDGFGDAPGLGALGPAEWAAYGEAIVAPNRDPGAHRAGRYAAEARRVRKRGSGCPFAAAAAARAGLAA